MGAFTEYDVESAALAWLKATGWRTAHGPDIAPPCLPKPLPALPAAQQAGRRRQAERRDVAEEGTTHAPG